MKQKVDVIYLLVASRQNNHSGPKYLPIKLKGASVPIFKGGGLKLKKGLLLVCIRYIDEYELQF